MFFYLLTKCCPFSTAKLVKIYENSKKYGKKFCCVHHFKVLRRVLRRNSWVFLENRQYYSTFALTNTKIYIFLVVHKPPACGSGWFFKR